MRNEYFETENFKYKTTSFLYGKMDKKTAILRTYAGKLDLTVYVLTKFNEETNDYYFEDSEMKSWFSITLDSLLDIQKDINQYVENDEQITAVADPITNITLLLDGDLEIDETKRDFLARSFSRHASEFEKAFGLN